MFNQQAVQFGQGLHRGAWGAKGQCGTDGGVQHPTSDRNDDAMADLYVDKFASGTALGIQAA